MLFVVSLLLAGAGGPGAWRSTFIARAQDDPLKALGDEYTRLESEGLKENFHRRLSYLMLQPYLPPGTRMTSGYRSPDKQLDLIQRYSRARGIPTSANATVADESSWRPALMALRAQGIIIAAPTTTPHGTDEAVFDLSGADLGAIQAGLDQAAKAGMVKYKRIIFERQNNAVHVEVESISPKAFNVLGKLKPLSSQGSSQSFSTGPSTTSLPPPSEADQRTVMLQQLQQLHDAEPDPVKKIDYDRLRKNQLDPTVDSAMSQSLDEEIELHKREAKELAKETRKKTAVEKVSAALREGNLEDAEREAKYLAKNFPGTKEAELLLTQIRTRRLVNDAMDALDRAGCGDCQEAAQFIEEALDLAPDHEGALFVKGEVEACLERCKTKRLAFLGVSVFVVMGLGAGVFFLFFTRSGSSLIGRATAARPQTWVLEGVDGAARGQLFPLNKTEITVGSQGPPAGTADIVILDAERKISRRHCRIVQNGPQFYVMDESTNGIKINEREVSKGVMVELRPGDRLSLADVAVLVLRPQ